MAESSVLKADSASPQPTPVVMFGCEYTLYLENHLMRRIKAHKTQLTDAAAADHPSGA
jgi:hypothetical protein